MSKKMYSELNLDKIGKLSGKEMKDKFTNIFNLLITVDRPLFFTGSPGTGKTVLAKALAKAYCNKTGARAFYLQLSPDMTKTSIILGLRLENGNLVPCKGVLAEAMEKGDIVIIDEATHTTQQMLLMFNSILDRESCTSIGDEIVHKNDRMRVIFCSNDSMCAGNIQLPQSFAQRVIFFNFEYPNREDEIAIATMMLKADLGENEIPEAIIKYIVSLIRKNRNKTFPLSVRNVVNALILLETCKKNDDLLEDEKKLQDAVSSFLMQKGSGESKIKNAYEAIHNVKEKDIQVISDDDELNEFLCYIAYVGIKSFKEAILNSCLFYADVDGFNSISKGKDMLEASILQ